MYQRQINLLPPEAQKERKMRLYMNRLRQLYRVLVAGVIMVGLAYGGAWWALLQSERSSQMDTTQVGTQHQEVEKNVRSINGLLSAIQGRIKARPPWMRLVEEALNAAPTGISITRVSLESDPNVLVLAGRSVSREAVVEYERRLHALSWAASVEAPLKNLASGPEVQFSFTVSRRSDTSVSPAPALTPQPSNSL